MNDTHSSITAELARFGRSLRFEELPDEAVRVAQQCILDGLGVALAGSDEPAVRAVLAVVGTSPDDGVTVLGRVVRCRLLDAALVNGTAAHALDFDDTHSTMSGHPTVPVLPAVLALAERDHRPGRDLLTAFVAGVEIECRLGALVNPAHYRRGFHATATLGTVGAAAAAAWLLDLEEEAWRHALGLAVTQAAGLKSAFGSMAKPLHAGRAAQSGLLAALLAAEGFSGHPAAVEAPQGLCETLAGVEPDPQVLAALRDRFLIRDTLFKFHAACYLTHSAIEGASALRRRLGDRVREIEAAEVEVPPASLRVCNIERPATGLEGKFSLRVTTALALLGDPTDDLATYSDRRMGESDLVEMRERVRIEPLEGASPTASPVRIRLAGGETLEETIDVGRPASDLDAQQERLRAKFRALVSPLLGDAATRELIDRALGLEALSSVAELLAACRPSLEARA